MAEKMVEAREKEGWVVFFFFFEFRVNGNKNLGENGCIRER